MTSDRGTVAYGWVHGRHTYRLCSPSESDGMSFLTPHADVSVRPAIPSDASAIAAIQIEAWQVMHTPIIGDNIMAALDADAITRQWNTTIEQAGEPGHAVMTALASDQVVGFAAVIPTALIALEVSPTHQRQGHGSRLLAACVERLRGDGIATVTCWVPRHDEPRQRFLASAGLAPSGRVRTLDIGEQATTSLTEERWTASLSESDSDPTS